MDYTDKDTQYIKDNWQRKTIAEMAVALGRSASSVRNRKWRLGLVDTSDNWTGEQLEQLRNLYSNQGWIGVSSFSESVGKSNSNVSRKARELGLPTSYHRKKTFEQRSPGAQARIKHRARTPEDKKQSLSFSHREAIRKYGHPRGYREIRTCPICGKFFEVEHSSPAKYCSRDCVRRRPIGMNQYTRGKGGKRKDLDNTYFRSSYEANYARYLNFLMANGEPIVKWEFEPDLFEFQNIKRGTRFYTPDFKLYFKDGHIEYHEVKGWDYPRGKTARRRFAKYYPQFTLVLIDSDWFKAIKQQGIDRLVNGWE